MDIRHISGAYHVTPQITPDEVTAIAEAGFATIICNRPDQEIPPGIQAEDVSAAAKAAGVAFHNLPLTHQLMTPENIALQASIVAGSDGPTLAYCASGTRCTVIWALGQAAEQSMSVDDILNTAQAAGYALEGLRPQLELIGQNT
jgi:uncharacterized protein (TIGR01244 family)